METFLAEVAEAAAGGGAWLLEAPTASALTGGRRPDGGDTELDLGIAIELPIHADRHRRLDLATALSESSDALRRAQVAVALADLAAAYARAWLAQTEVELRAEDLAITEAWLETTRRRVDAGADPPYEAILVGGERDRALLELVAARREVELAWGELSQLAALAPRPTPLDLSSLPGQRDVSAPRRHRRHRARGDRGPARPRAPARARALRGGVEPVGGRGRRRARRRGGEHRARGSRLSLRSSGREGGERERPERGRSGGREPGSERDRVAPRAPGGSRGGAGVAGAGARGRRSASEPGGRSRVVSPRARSAPPKYCRCDGSSSTRRWRAPQPAPRERRPWPSSSCSKGATRDDLRSVALRIGRTSLSRSAWPHVEIDRRRPSTATTTITPPARTRRDTTTARELAHRDEGEADHDAIPLAGVRGVSFAEVRRRSRRARGTPPRPWRRSSSAR